MKKIKVLHFITGLKMGGAERMLLRVLPKMSPVFDNVVCSTQKGEIGDILTEKGIPVYYFKATKFNLLRTILDFRKIIIREKPDILVTYLIHADLFGRVFGRLFGVKKIICSERGILLQWGFLRFFDRLTSFMVDKYICVSEKLKNELINKWRFPVEKVVAIPNAVDLTEFNIDVNVKNKKKELGISENDFVLTYVANLRKKKGHLELLESLASLKTSYPNFILLLIGEDQGEGDKIKRTIQRLGLEQNVEILGFRKDVLEILKITDIFVFPSLGEGMSNALLEAMASGCAIVANNIPENRELIEDQTDGFLINAQNPKAFSDSIKQLIEKPDLRRKFQHNAGLKIRQKFTIQKTVSRLEKIYQAVLNSL